MFIEIKIQGKFVNLGILKIFFILIYKLLATQEINNFVIISIKKKKKKFKIDVGNNYSFWSNFKYLIIY